MFNVIHPILRTLCFISYNNPSIDSLNSLNKSKTKNLKKTNSISAEKISHFIKYHKDCNDITSEEIIKMIEWWETYVDSEEFIALYFDTKSILLTAEASYWTKKLNLDQEIKKWPRIQIQEFSPIKKSKHEDEVGQLIYNVFQKLRIPTQFSEAEYALIQAAWSVYVHENGYNSVISQSEDFEVLELESQKK